MMYYVLENHSNDDDGRDSLTDNSFPAHGPFSSIEAAERCIRKDVMQFLDEEQVWELGEDADYAGKYTIVKVVKEVQPIVHISAKVTLKKYESATLRGGNEV